MTDPETFTEEQVNAEADRQALLAVLADVERIKAFLLGLA